MNPLSKVARERRSYAGSVQDLLASSFHLSPVTMATQNHQWRGWVELGQNPNELLEANVSDAYKARAIAILLAPSLSLVPFPWRANLSRSDLAPGSGFHRIQLNSLTSPRLKLFMLELLELTCDFVTKPGSDQSLREMMDVYNTYILQALAELPEDVPLAQGLFGRYELNDPIPYYTIDEASGYSPFERLLFAKIPEKWKELADYKLRYIILAELEGRAQPREEWEKALPRYATIVRYSLCSSHVPYSVDLLASQIEFILGSSQDDDESLFGRHDVHRVLELLYGNKFKELTRRLIRRAMIAERDGSRVLTVDNDADNAIVASLVKEFEEDLELKHWLTDVIARGDTWTRERREVENQWKERVQKVLARMS